MNPGQAPSEAELHAIVDDYLEQAAACALRGRFVDVEMERGRGHYLTARLIAPPRASATWPTFWEWAGMLWAATLPRARYGARR